MPRTSRAARKVVDMLDGREPAADSPTRANTLVLDYASPKHHRIADARLLALRAHLADLDGERVEGLCMHGLRVCGACLPMED
jgi:hypothetical protein